MLHFYEKDIDLHFVFSCRLTSKKIPSEANNSSFYERDFFSPSENGFMWFWSYYICIVNPNQPLGHTLIDEKITTLPADI